MQQSSLKRIFRREAKFGVMELSSEFPSKISSSSELSSSEEESSEESDEMTVDQQKDSSLLVSMPEITRYIQTNFPLTCFAFADSSGWIDVKAVITFLCEDIYENNHYPTFDELVEKAPNTLGVLEVIDKKWFENELSVVKIQHHYFVYLRPAYIDVKNDKSSIMFRLMKCVTEDYVLLDCATPIIANKYHVKCGQIYRQNGTDKFAMVVGMADDPHVGHYRLWFLLSIDDKISYWSIIDDHFSFPKVFDTSFIYNIDILKFKDYNFDRDAFIRYLSIKYPKNE